MAAPTCRSSLLAAVFIAVLLGGCASTGERNPKDPLEGFNRASYKFNDAVDRAVLKPVATGYRAVVPQFVRTGVNNFFSNIYQVNTIVNDLLQGKFRQGGEDTGRLILNTTFGIGGLIDFASVVGVPKRHEDFGQTLGVWGVKPGPYLVVPFLGPSTLRDTGGRFVDSQFGYWSYVDNMALRNSMFATETVNTRSNLLDAEKVLDEAALDRYVFLRDAYLQRRERAVYDGNPPKKPDEQEDEQYENSSDPATPAPTINIR